jgi:hypothetical protein
MARFAGQTGRMGDHFALPLANESNSSPPVVVPGLRWEELPGVRNAAFATGRVTHCDRAASIEQRPGREVTEISFLQDPVAEVGGGILAAPGSRAYNPVSDVTPPELAPAVVLDNGADSRCPGPLSRLFCTPCDSSHDQVMG